jgi:preprotein translocase subunit YajC
VHLSGLAFFQAVSPPAAPAGPQTNTGVSVPAPAGAPQGPAPSQPSPLPSLLLPLLFIPFLFLMFRRNKKEDAARKSLKKGDRIASTSGLVGELIEMEERFSKVKLGPGNTVTMLTSSLLPLDAGTAKSDDKDLKDLKDAKAVAADKK